MLFNSYLFLFGFLPVVFLGFFWLGRSSHSLAALWLAAASLFFYGWWNPAFVPLLLCSIVFNYSMGYLAVRRGSKLLLGTAVAANLVLLFFYKYTVFLIANLNRVLGVAIPAPDIELPIGISFFTFTQIAFLLDAWAGKAREYRFIHYCLFVSYFPHLIAGPVLHHRQMMPQFGLSSTYRIHWDNIAVGSAIFALGLFKKTVLADGIAGFATPVFDAARDGATVYFFEAWIGALSYTLQLYFDFSGYSDMAIGLSRLFNVKLPLNFDSPYKAVNIIDFWRRWHMTLSQFLRDYLYIPLGGNRHGSARRYVNLMLTMLLGGLWHGAGWTFVIWGALHGLYLMINHAWLALRGALGLVPGQAGWLSRRVSQMITFLAVVVAWVFFRAADAASAWRLLQAMAGLQGVSLPESFAGIAGLSGISGDSVLFAGLTTNMDVQPLTALLWIGALLAIVWLLPNTQQVMRAYEPALERVEPPSSLQWLHWRPDRRWAATTAVIMAVSLLHLNKVSEFLYFQF